MHLAGRPQALTQLRDLAGNSHELNSAVAVAHDGQIVFEDVSVARMTMRGMTEEELSAYLDAAGDAVVDVVIRDGVEVRSVTSLGRTIRRPTGHDCPSARSPLIRTSSPAKPGRTRAPIAVDAHTDGRFSDSRAPPVDHSTGGPRSPLPRRTAAAVSPSARPPKGWWRLSFPLTAAGQSRIRTGFPLAPASPGDTGPAATGSSSPSPGNPPRSGGCGRRSRRRR